MSKWIFGDKVASKLLVLIWKPSERSLVHQHKWWNPAISVVFLWYLGWLEISFLFFKKTHKRVSRIICFCDRLCLYFCYQLWVNKYLDLKYFNISYIGGMPVQVMWVETGCQMIICRSQFSSRIWVLGVELRSSELERTIFILFSPAVVCELQFYTTWFGEMYCNINKTGK